MSRRSGNRTTLKSQKDDIKETRRKEFEERRRGRVLDKVERMDKSEERSNGDNSLSRKNSVESVASLMDNSELDGEFVKKLERMGVAEIGDVDTWEVNHDRVSSVDGREIARRADLTYISPSNKTIVQDPKPSSSKMETLEEEDQSEVIRSLKETIAEQKLKIEQLESYDGFIERSCSEAIRVVGTPFQKLISEIDPEKNLEAEEITAVIISKALEAAKRAARQEANDDSTERMKEAIREMNATHMSLQTLAKETALALSAITERSTVEVPYPVETKIITKSSAEGFIHLVFSMMYEHEGEHFLLSSKFYDAVCSDPGRFADAVASLTGRIQSQNDLVSFIKRIKKQYD